MTEQVLDRSHLGDKDTERPDGAASRSGGTPVPATAAMPPAARIRAARPQDIKALLRLETQCFTTDRITARSFRHILTRGHADTLLRTRIDADGREETIGYAMVLYHQGTSLARLYSFCVAPECRGLGHGQALLQAAEHAALDRGCVVMRLEVRADNTATQAMYRAAGYRKFGSHANYYEDHADALRFEKHLAPDLRPEVLAVPYFRQSTDFTCGPAALMMAMGALDPAICLDRKTELRLWRESTTIYMTSGHGGTGPHGLALAARRRGFDVTLYLPDSGPLFLDTVRNAAKREVMRLVQEDFEGELGETDVTVHSRALTLDEMEAALAAGSVPVVLISSYAIYGEKFPHWIVVVGHDDHFVYAHDPYVDAELGKTEMDSIKMPIPRRDFERMARFGRSRLKAALVLSPRRFGSRRNPVSRP